MSLALFYGICSQDRGAGCTNIDWRCCADLFLPTGYPDTLTPDYLEYQLWSLPVHVTGWLANSLATSSMLKAAGIGSSAAGAVAAGAAIKWITKDGIGALGRVLVGGGLARFFDEDPRFWRFWADVVKCFGQALEVATPLYPDMFIVLAGTGNLTKVQLLCRFVLCHPSDSMNLSLRMKSSEDADSSQ